MNMKTKKTNGKKKREKMETKMATNELIAKSMWWIGRIAQNINLKVVTLTCLSISI